MRSQVYYSVTVHCGICFTAARHVYYYSHRPIGYNRLLFDLCVCVCVCACVCVCICTVTDFSTENKASGVNFCTAVHRLPRQGITHFGQLCSPEAKIERIRG